MKNKIKTIMYFMFILVLTTFVNAIGFSCVYDDTPYIVNEIRGFENKINWICNSTISNYSCLTTIEKQGEYLQVNPDQEKIDGQGVIDKFESNGNIITVYFKPEANIILGGESYNFSVYCGNGSEVFAMTDNVTPVYRDDLVFVTARGVWLRDNIGYVIIWTLVIILIILIVGYAYNRTKN